MLFRWGIMFSLTIAGKLSSGVARPLTTKTDFNFSVSPLYNRIHLSYSLQWHIIRAIQRPAGGESGSYLSCVYTDAGTAMTSAPVSILKHTDSPFIIIFSFHLSLFCGLCRHCTQIYCICCIWSCLYRMEGLSWPAHNCKMSLLVAFSAFDILCWALTPWMLCGFSHIFHRVWLG